MKESPRLIEFMKKSQENRLECIRFEGNCPKADDRYRPIVKELEIYWSLYSIIDHNDDYKEILDELIEIVASHVQKEKDRVKVMLAERERNDK